MQTSLHINDKEYEVNSKRLDGMPERYTLSIRSGESEIVIFNDEELTLNTVDHLEDILYRFAEDVLQTKNTDDLQELVGNYMEEL
jgi:hypothetical protein